MSTYEYEYEYGYEYGYEHAIDRVRVCARGDSVVIRTVQLRTVDYSETKMGRMSMEVRSRVVVLAEAGMSVGKIQSRLLEEGVKVSRVSLYQLLKKYKTRGVVRDLRWWKPPTIFSDEQYRFIDEKMAANTELTSLQLSRLIHEAFPNVRASISTYTQPEMPRCTFIGHTALSNHGVIGLAFGSSKEHYIEQLYIHVHVYTSVSILATLPPSHPLEVYTPVLHRTM